MFHPSILGMYQFQREQREMNPIDACTDVAYWHDISAQVFAQFLVTMGIDADRLSLLV